MNTIQELGRTLAILSIASAASLANAQGLDSTKRASHWQHKHASRQQYFERRQHSCNRVHGYALGQSARGPDRASCRRDSKGERYGRKGENDSRPKRGSGNVCRRRKRLRVNGTRGRATGLMESRTVNLRVKPTTQRGGVRV